jgi:SSS family solute:Na+ symporter
MFYGALSWQGSQAYQSSGISPHEQKMGQIIFPWVYAIRLVGLMLLAVTALTFLNHPNYASQAAEANEVLEGLRESDVPQLAVQQRVPVALSYMLPTGLRGLFCVSMVFLLITTQDTYMHSWGSIFVQDILLPLLQKRISPEQHVRWLRWSICGVAVFAILFASFYKPSEFIQMYFAITGAVFSGLGCAIIGGLYWKYGGTLAAYVAVSIGAVLSIARIVLQQYTEQIAAVPNKGLLLRLVDYFNTQVTSQIIWFWIMMICIIVYIFLSLIDLRDPFNLDKMLHRGKYDDKGDHQKATNKWQTVWLKVIGITDEFSRFDQLLAITLVLWNALWVSIFVVVTVTHYFVIPIENAWWNSFWHVWIYVQIGVGIPAMVWFTIGGVRDIRAVFQRLATSERDATDDGTVFKD